MRTFKLIQIVFIFFLSASALGQVGINTTNPTTTLDVNGAVSLKPGTLSLTNGNNNNIDLGAVPLSVYRIDGPTNDFKVSGIIPVEAADGQLITLINTTDEEMTLRHDTASNPTQRILCPGGDDIVLGGQYATVTLIYSAADLRWFVTTYASAN